MSGRQTYLPCLSCTASQAAAAQPLGSGLADTGQLRLASAVAKDILAAALGVGIPTILMYLAHAHAISVKTEMAR